MEQTKRWENDPIELASQITDQYRLLMGQTKERREPVIFETRTTFHYDHVLENIDIFEKYLPFIQKNFDSRNTFDISFIVLKLRNEAGKKLLKEGLSLFEKYPYLIDLYDKYGYESAGKIKDGKNTGNIHRLMFANLQESGEEAVTQIEEIIENNRDLYRKLDQKFADIGDREIVIAKISGDADVCLRFLNRGETTDVNKACQIMIRPVAGGSVFESYSVDVTKRGLIQKADFPGFLFLAPPYSKIDEKALFELMASEKTNKEIEEDLNKGAAGVEEYIFSQPPLIRSTYFHQGKPAI